MRLLFKSLDVVLTLSNLYPITHLFQDAAFMDLKTKYEDFVNIKGRVVNPLNIASNQKRQPRTGVIEPMWTVIKSSN